MCRRQGASVLVNFKIFFLSSLEHFEHFKCLGTKFEIWAPKDAIASVPYDTVFTFLRCRRTCLQKLYL